MVCRGRPDRGESAAEVLDRPIVAVTATGTVVVPAGPTPVSARAVCVDVGSTYTKAAWSTSTTRRLVGAAEHPTTSDTDVLHGSGRRGRAAAARRTPTSSWYVCSSAGGGLRLAVVGYERAGHRRGRAPGRAVGRGAGGARGRRPARRRRRSPALRAAAPGRGAARRRHRRRRRARCCCTTPRRLAAGPAAGAGGGGRQRRRPRRRGRGAADRAGRAGDRRRGNVLPRIGVLDPAPARAAIREVFLRHVIGGKRLSRGPRFASLVRAATPDAVLAGGGAARRPTGAGDLLVVDVGGATTDVYSALLPDAEREPGRAATSPARCGGPAPSRATSACGWSAPGVVAAAAAGAAARAGRGRRLRPARRPSGGRAGGSCRRPPTGGSRPRLADPRPRRCAVRRARAGRDLRDVRLVVGSGGVLRHGRRRTAVLAAVLTDTAGGWALPRAARAGGRQPVRARRRPACSPPTIRRRPRSRCVRLLRPLLGGAHPETTPSRRNTPSERDTPGTRSGIRLTGPPGVPTYRLWVLLREAAVVRFVPSPAGRAPASSVPGPASARSSGWGSAGRRGPAAWSGWWSGSGAGCTGPVDNGRRGQPARAGSVRRRRRVRCPPAGRAWEHGARRSEPRPDPFGPDCVTTCPSAVARPVGCAGSRSAGRSGTLRGMVDVGGRQSAVQRRGR